MMIRTVLTIAVMSFVSLFLLGDLVSARIDTAAVKKHSEDSKQLLGCLTTTGNQSITVDGREAKTGDSIFPGDQIQTPDGRAASVYVSGVGRLDLASNSSLIFNFSGSNAYAQLTMGCAVLTVDDGVAAILKSESEVEKTEGDAGGRIKICAGGNLPGSGSIVRASFGETDEISAEEQAEATVRHCDRLNAGWFGSGGMFALLGTGGTVITAAAVHANNNCIRPSTSSPSTPAGPNQCQ